MATKKKVAKKKATPKKATAVAPMTATEAKALLLATHKPRVYTPELEVDSDEMTVNLYDDMGDFVGEFGIAESNNGFNNCCGAVEIGGFSNPSPGNVPAETAAMVLLRDEIFTAKAHIIATTTPAQTGVISVLRGAGFKEVGTAVNPGSRNPVTMWLASKQ